ncbi:hypothetical protein K449DRAFT_394685 [Hypoxylon sp. EC38]|nr:hypothetical protein K449DRAFT_394685 [Hypoxylon sp. EC38]
MLSPPTLPKIRIPNFNYSKYIKEATPYNVKQAIMSAVEEFTVLLLVSWVVVGLLCGFYIAIGFFFIRTPDETRERTARERTPRRRRRSGYRADDELDSNSSDSYEDSLTMPERQYLYNSVLAA